MKTKTLNTSSQLETAAKNRKKLLDKLMSERKECAKSLKFAIKQEADFKNKIRHNSAYYSETCFGSSTAATIYSNMQDKYHLARWFVATKSIQRRYNRLNRLIEKKL